MLIDKEQARQIQVFAHRAPINIPEAQAYAWRSYNKIKLLLTDAERRELLLAWQTAKQGGGRNQFDKIIRNVMNRVYVK